MLSGIVPLDAGRVACGGQIVAQLELGAARRDFSGRENIFLNGALHGLVKEQIEERLDAIIASPSSATSSTRPSRRTRRAVPAPRLLDRRDLDADVLLIDERLAVGDEAFQRKCEARSPSRSRRARRRARLHDPALIERTSSA